MKKSLFTGFIALAALTMTSCSNDENMVSIPQDNAIEFGTYVGRDAQTRGVVLNDANLSDFGVYAFYTSNEKWTDAATPNFMYNQEVERTSTSWTYSPKKYWPTKNTFEYISFFAFAPFHNGGDNGIAVKSANTDTGTPTLTYTINTDKLNLLADFTADVIMDESKGLAGANPDNSDQEVTFDFKHELTRLGITAKLDRAAFDGTADKTKVNIKQIDFTGSGFATEATYKFANVSNAKGAWTYTAAASPLNVVAGATGSVLANNNKTPYWIDDYTQSGFLLENAVEKNIFVDDNYLFLIPPTADGTSASNKVAMRIHYDIVTHDTKLSNNHSVTSAVKEIEVPVGLLKQGKAYNFVLTFNLNEIVFDASVVGWEAAIGSDSNVDWPDTDI